MKKCSAFRSIGCCNGVIPFHAPDRKFSVHYMPPYIEYLPATLMKFFTRASSIPTWRFTTLRKLQSCPRQRWDSKCDYVSPLCSLLTHLGIVYYRTLSISSSRGRKGKLRQWFTGKFLSCGFSSLFENNWNSGHSVSTLGTHTQNERFVFKSRSLGSTNKWKGRSWQKRFFFN